MIVPWVWRWNFVTFCVPIADKITGKSLEILFEELPPQTQDLHRFFRQLRSELDLQDRLHIFKLTRPFVLLTFVALWTIGYAFVFFDFGMFRAALIFLLFPLPSVFVAFRLRTRLPTVRGHEIGFLVILSLFATGAAIFVVRDWYDRGLHHAHAEDVQWSQLENFMRRDSAFQNVKIRLTDRKHIYYVEGTVNSNADLERLLALAYRCGIKRKRLDGPFVHSVSLTVSPNGSAE